MCGDSKYQAQPMNQSFVAAFNAATSYKPIVWARPIEITIKKQ
jgi:hypothetical protein